MVGITLGAQATAMLGVVFLKPLPTEQPFLLSYNVLEELRKLEFCFTHLQILGSPNPTAGSKPSAVSKAV